MQMVYMPDFRARRFVAGGLMPTFDLMPNFFFRTGFYAMYRDKRDFNPLGGVRPALALRRRGVVGLPYADRSREPRPDEIRGAELEEHVSDLQFRLCDLRPQRGRSIDETRTAAFVGRASF